MTMLMASVWDISALGRAARKGPGDRCNDLMLDGLAHGQNMFDPIERFSIGGGGRFAVAVFETVGPVYVSGKKTTCAVEDQIVYQALRSRSHRDRAPGPGFLCSTGLRHRRM